MNPTLYDILGVRPDATPDQIKRAWRDAADRFEPGSGSSGAQFRLFNEAAEVLLDPAKRAEYDAGLAGGSGAAAPGRFPRLGKSKKTDKTENTDSTDSTTHAGTAGKAEPAEKVAPAAPVAPATAAAPSASDAGTGPSTPLLAGLGVLALVLVVAAAVLGLVVWSYPAVRQQDRADEAAQTAPAAAERAAATILSYDYTSLDTDEKAAERYMTTSYAKEYADTFDKLVRPNAAKLHAKVVADVRASGVQHADPDRVNVLLFVNQSTKSTANSGQEQLALNRVELKMVRQGDTWLVDDIASY
ncbi:MAG: J domain-containing protein [Nocardioides sp.]